LKWKNIFNNVIAFGKNTVVEDINVIFQNILEETEKYYEIQL
jgi:hypothetical protein